MGEERSNPARELPRRDPGVEDARARLLEWSVDADAALHEQVHQVIESVTAKTRRVLPWAIGGIVVMGLLGRRRKGDAGPARSWIGTLRTAIAVATTVLPLVRPFFEKKPESE